MSSRPLGHDIEMPVRLFGGQLNLHFRRGSQVGEIRLRRQSWQNLLDSRDPAFEILHVMLRCLLRMSPILQHLAR